MNIYHQLNKMIEYIENNLDNKISYNELSKFLGVNEYTMQQVFNLLCNMSVSTYIRKRRLSNAGYDLYNNKVNIIDIALKYGYENATSFSRAFYKFHGVKPSCIKKGNYQLNIFPKLVFDEKNNLKEDIKYEIIELNELKLYGKGFKTTEKRIGKDAPQFFKKMKKQYDKYGQIDYGMVLYEERFNSPNFEYWVLWNKKIDEFDTITIPKSKWLVFKIPSTEASEIQKMSRDFNLSFLPSCKFNLRKIPELEYYHDGVTDFLVAIE